MFRKLFVPSISLGIGLYIGTEYERRNDSRGRPFTVGDEQSNQSYFPLPVVTAASVPALTNTNVATTNTALSTSAAEIMKFGFPNFDNVRSYDDFVLAYDRRNKNAHWVFEHLHPDKLNSTQESDRTRSTFQEDEIIHHKFRSTNGDYKGSGYDRGHLAAARNHRHSQRALDQTFNLTNVSPQVGPGFNRGAWNDLEKYVRSLARKNRNTYVCTGPLYLPKKEVDGKLYVRYEVIGRNHVSVPTHFFKVVVMETNKGDYEMLSFVLPNQPLLEGTKLKHYLTPVDAIERAAGFILFDKLPKNKLRLVNGQKVS